MKRVISLVLLVLSFCMAYAQSASGDWASQLAYRNNSFNVPMGEEVYSLCEGNLFAYDTKTTEVRLLSKLDGMNGKYVSFMGYSTTQHCLILVYNDGNIDIRPMRQKKVNLACRYCEFKGICRFDTGFRGCTFNIIK